MSHYSSGFYSNKRERNLSRKYDDDYTENDDLKIRLDRTKHAQTRIQQRGFSDLAIELIEVFGKPTTQKGGTELLRIPAQLVENLRKAINHVDGASIVFNPETNKIITAQHNIKN